MSREYTVEEVRSMFLHHIFMLVNYWANLPGQSTHARLEGLAFSILTALDGESGLPAFVVAPAPHPDDRQYCIDEGENYYPEAPHAPCNISGSLHEQLGTARSI